jgi:hypothetical protein
MSMILSISDDKVDVDRGMAKSAQLRTAMNLVAASIRAPVLAQVYDQRGVALPRKGCRSPLDFF